MAREGAFEEKRNKQMITFQRHETDHTQRHGDDIIKDSNDIHFFGACSLRTNTNGIWEREVL